jgi:hypothetical protein
MSSDHPLKSGPVNVLQVKQTIVIKLDTYFVILREPCTSFTPMNKQRRATEESLKRSFIPSATGTLRHLAAQSDIFDGTLEV